MAHEGRLQQNKQSPGQSLLQHRILSLQYGEGGGGKIEEKKKVQKKRVQQIEN